MAIIISCPSCEHQMKVKDELAGRKVKCSQCGKAIPVSAPEEEEEAPSPPAPKRTTAKKAPWAEPPRKKARVPLDDDEEEDEDEESTPRKKKEKKDEAPALGLHTDLRDSDLGMRILGVVFLGLGAVLAYFGVWMPIAEAHAGKESISLYNFGAGLTVATLVGGFLLAAAGKQTNRFLVTKTWREANALQVLGSLLIIFLCVVIQVGFSMYLKSLGYVGRF